jgi:hypothetical protein
VRSSSTSTTGRRRATSPASPTAGASSSTSCSPAARRAGASGGCGCRSHLRAGVTTGTLKLVAIPLWALWRTRSPSGAVLVALTANLLNQLDTRPGRALKAFLLGSLALGGRPRGALAVAVLLAPYDHREMAMLGDAGSNALGAVLGLESVRRLTGLRRTSAIVALATVTLIGERRSLGALIESSPVLGPLDAIGREP